MSTTPATENQQSLPLHTWIPVADVVPGLVLQTPYGDRHTTFEIHEVGQAFTVEIDGCTRTVVEWSGWITDTRNPTDPGHQLTGCRQDPIRGRVWLLADLRDLIAY